MLIITIAQVARQDELKALVEEFRMPIVRMEQDLHVLLDGLEGMSASIIESRTAFIDMIFIADKKREEICTWLSDIPHSRYHRTASKNRKEGTCQWILKTAKFQAW